MLCRTCAGDGLEYDGIERGVTPCNTCHGTGMSDDVATTTLEERARVQAQKAIDEMCQTSARPRDIVQRALVTFVLSERKIA